LVLSFLCSFLSCYTSVRYASMPSVCPSGTQSSVPAFRPAGVHFIRRAYVLSVPHSCISSHLPSGSQVHRCTIRPYIRYAGLNVCRPSRLTVQRNDEFRDQPNFRSHLHRMSHENGDIGARPPTLFLSPLYHRDNPAERIHLSLHPQNESGSDGECRSRPMFWHQRRLIRPRGGLCMPAGA